MPPVVPFGVSCPRWLPDGRSLLVATSAVPELAGAWTAEDRARMKREIRRRRDSKISAKVTENRQYRYWDHWLTDNLANRLLRVDLASVNNSYAQYGTDAPHGFPLVMGGKPWETLEGMQGQNPMFDAKNFRTPTLVIHGELDYRVPYGNATELYGVLQAMGVPSRLVIYPNENHWILTPQNALHWHWEMQSWLSRYLGGMPTLEEPRFDSPAR